MKQAEYAELKQHLYQNLNVSLIFYDNYPQYLIYYQV